MGTDSDILHDVFQTFDGNYLLAGGKSVKIGMRKWVYYGWLIKLSPFGNILWQKTYGVDTANQHFRKVVQLPDSSLSLGGNRTNLSSSSSSGRRKVWLVKMDRMGDKLWMRKYNHDFEDDFHDWMYDMKTGISGGYIFTGGTKDSVTYQDSWVLKVDSMGCLEPGCATTSDTGDMLLPPEAPDSIEVYPNPVRDQAKFVIPKKILPSQDPQNAPVKLMLYDMLGRRVQPSITILRKTNWVELRLNGHSLSPGVYIYRLHSAGAPIKTGKVVVQ